MKETKLILKDIVDALEDKMAVNIAVIDIDEVSSLAEYFVIANGSSSTQVKALSESVEARMDKEEIPLLHQEGYRGSEWILLDYGTVVVHIFDNESRTFYNLEKIWGDGKIVEIDSL